VIPLRWFESNCYDEGKCLVAGTNLRQYSIRITASYTERGHGIEHTGQVTYLVLRRISLFKQRPPEVNLLESIAK